MKFLRLTKQISLFCLVISIHINTAEADVIYEEIDDIEVISFSLRLAHTYEVIIPNTVLGNMIRCDILNSNGESVPSHSSTGVGPKIRTIGDDLSIQTNRTEQNETSFYFANKILNATFQCFYMRVE